MKWTFFPPSASWGRATALPASQAQDKSKDLWVRMRWPHTNHSREKEHSGCHQNKDLIKAHTSAETQLNTFQTKAPPPPTKDSKQRWPEERAEETDFFLQPGVKFMLVKTNKGQKRKSTTKEKYKTIICVPGRQDGSIFSQDDILLHHHMLRENPICSWQTPNIFRKMLKASENMSEILSTHCIFLILHTGNSLVHEF